MMSLGTVIGVALIALVIGVGFHTIITWLIGKDNK